jgi:hypothetical protein
VNYSDPRQREALERQHSRGYLPAYEADFQEVRALVRELGLD